jgi:hypothetical protein
MHTKVTYDIYRGASRCHVTAFLLGTVHNRPSLLHHLSSRPTVSLNSSYDVILPSEGMNPGLVEEGTKCGDGMVCELQRCVSLSSQSFPTCPSANGQQCSGPSRGVSSSVVANITHVMVFP